jgi:ABC-2 type transport system ATP-binding protein
MNPTLGGLARQVEIVNEQRESSAAMLEISGIEVRYGTFTLGPVSMSLASGQIISLLGPNGSGKSTLIRSVLGLQRTDAGKASWDGVDLPGRPPRTLARIGALTDSPDDVIPELTPQEYWEFCAMAYARYEEDASAAGAEMLRRADALATSLDFSPPRRSIAGFSLGMRRKTQLIASMIHSPDLLVLDEPLIGLDFISIRALESVLSTERQRGALVWMASHDLGVAGRLADRAVVLHLGRLILDVEVSAIPAGETLEDRVEAAIKLARSAGLRK